MRTSLATWITLGAVLIIAFDGSHPVSRAAQPGMAPVGVSVWSSRLAWSAPPSSQVVGRVLTPQGDKRAEGTSLADVNGAVVINVQGTGLAGGPYVRAGDTIVLTIQGGTTLTTTVPAPFAAGVDPATNAVAGMAPPDSALEVGYRYEGAADVVSSTVGADTGGRFRWSLGDGRKVSGGDEGTVVLRTAEGHAFSHRMHGLAVVLPLGARQASGSATSGSLVKAVFALPDGTVTQPVTRTVHDNQSWQLRIPGTATIVPGTVVTVTASGPAAPDWAVVARATELAVNYDRARKRVVGEGPPDRPVVVEVSIRSGVISRVAQRTGRTGPDGRFAVDLADVEGLRVGAILTTKVFLEDGVTVQKAMAIPGVRLAVYGAGVIIADAPGTAFTMTLSAANGPVKTQLSGKIETTGVYDSLLFDLASGGFFSIMPGDRVEIELTAGDPIILSIPRLTSAVDVATDHVSGDALPGAEVRLTWLTGLGTERVGRERLGRAGADGRYDVSLAALGDLQRGDGGTLEVMADRGAEYVAPWTAPRVSVYLGNANIGGASSPGRTVSLRLETPEGGLLGSGTGLSQADPQTGGPGGWNISLISSAGEAVKPRPGDVLKADLADETVVLPLPELSAVTHVEDDTIVGRTTPGVTVTVSASKVNTGNPAPNQIVEVRSDAAGIFRHHVDAFDLAYRDRVSVGVNVDGHEVWRDGATPGLTVDLDAGSVTGVLEPGVAVNAEVRRSGRLVGSARTTTDLDAQFSTPILDSSGAPLRLAAGDELILRAPEATTYQELPMTMPELVVDPVQSPGGVRGRATPGGTLIVRLDVGLSALGAGFGDGSVRLGVGPSGEFAADFAPAANLRRNNILKVNYILPSGHQVVMQRALAMVRAEIGASRACGVAEPNRRVEAQLKAASGTSRATAAARSAPNLRYTLNFTSPTGSSAPVVAGDELQLDVEGDAWTFAVPPFDASLDWRSGLLTGHGPTGWHYALYTYYDGCFSEVTSYGNLGATGSSASVSPTGTLRINVATSSVRPRYGVQLEAASPDGNQLYHQFYRAFGRAFVRTERIEGRVNPRSSLTVTLLGVGDSPLGAAAATSGDDGWFQARIVDASGQGVAARPGDRVRLDAPGETPQFTVADVDFDFSASAGIDGSAPPGSQVQVELELADGRSFRFRRAADDQGRFHYRPDELPARSNWTLGDVRRIRVTYETSDGYETATEALVGAPVTPGHKLTYLPFGLKGAAR